MTYITVTLEKGADASFISKMMENIKGVAHACVSIYEENGLLPASKQQEIER